MHNQKNSSIPKAIMLGLAIVAMVPVASNWETMFGSVREQIEETAEVVIPEEEPVELEEEVHDLKKELEELKVLLKKLR